MSEKRPESWCSRSARAEVTASGAGRLCDEQSFVHSAALGCIKVPSGAGKTEILVKTQPYGHGLLALLRLRLLYTVPFLPTGGVPHPVSLDTHLCYAAWRSTYSSRASIGV